MIKKVLVLVAVWALTSCDPDIKYINRKPKVKTEYIEAKNEKGVKALSGLVANLKRKHEQEVKALNDTIIKRDLTIEGLKKDIKSSSGKPAGGGAGVEENAILKTPLNLVPHDIFRTRTLTWMQILEQYLGIIDANNQYAKAELKEMIITGVVYDGEADNRYRPGPRGSFGHAVECYIVNGVLIVEPHYTEWYKNMNKPLEVWVVLRLKKENRTIRFMEQVRAGFQQEFHFKPTFVKVK